MREIKFRGKSDDIGWVYGDVVINCTANPYILDDHGFEWDIIPETVGQFTGLKDKNGKEIYEGDEFRDEEGEVAVVKFEDGGFRLGWYDGIEESFYEVNHIDYYYLETLEPIGNIHDNPELLNVK